MIYNETQECVLIAEHVILTNMFSQAIGLMFKRKPITKGYVFDLPWKADWDVTNIFVFHDIDVLWLDDTRRVHKIRTVPAWKAKVAGHPKSRYCIELPAGAARAVENGDQLSWNKKAL